MTHFDFYVTHQEFEDGDDVITVAKQSMTDNRGVLLDTYLTKLSVSDSIIGETIEKLEGLPNGVAQAIVYGGHGRIVINQSW